MNLMARKFDIKKIWVTSVEVMAKRPVVILPFFIIAFLEGLALELISFSTRRPLSFIAGPIIRKFSGDAFLHYPYSLLKLPKYFYYSQILVFIFAGVVLMAISVNIFKNIQGGLPLKANALIKNASKKYLSFLVFGIIIAVLMLLLEKADRTIIAKLEQFTSGFLPQITHEFYSFAFTIFLFLSNIIMQAFLVLTVPIMVIKKTPLLKAIWGSIGMGFRNFFGIFTLIFLPSILYLPIALLKAYSPNFIATTFPEIGLYIIGVGIVVTIFVECFIIVCASGFLLEKEKTVTG